MTTQWRRIVVESWSIPPIQNGCTFSSQRSLDHELRHVAAAVVVAFHEVFYLHRLKHFSRYSCPKMQPSAADELTAQSIDYEMRGVWIKWVR